MILLASTSDQLQLVTSAAGQVDVHTSWADVSGTTVTVGRQNTRIATATTTAIVPSPGASTSRNVKRYMIANNHASITNTVTIQHTDGTNVIVLDSLTLAPSERASYNEVMGLRAYDAAGREKIQSAMQAPGVGGTAQVTANAADTYITGSGFNVGGRLKAGSALRWAFSVTKTAAGVAAPIFVVRAGTAGTTADTARLTFTGTVAQTAVADDGVVEVMAEVRDATATGVLEGWWRLGHRLATTGLSAQAQDQYLVVTSAAFDLTVSNLVVGVSVNPGAAGVWTIKCISMQAINLLA